MNFPVYFHVFGQRVHPHLVLELIAYAGGFQIYLWLRRRAARAGVGLAAEPNLWVIVGAILGAAVGSKVLAWAESWSVLWAHRGDAAAWMGGKTIVGGLLGGWIGVEIAKWGVGVRRSTGDLFVFPLIFGMAVGRVGCFLTGLEDHTHGVGTSLPWGVNFGDGVRRHPTQLYDIVFLAGMAVMLVACCWRSSRGEGRVFRWFMLGYLLWRFFVEFIKPREIRGVGLSAIQMAALAGAGVIVWQLMRVAVRGGPSPPYEERPVLV